MRKAYTGIDSGGSTMMGRETSSESTGRPSMVVGESRLTDAVADANALLYHAVASGREVPAAVRDPIIHLNTAMSQNAAVRTADEGAFLDAYARLAAQVAPVTAVTLRATSRTHGRFKWWAKLLRLGPVSEAQRFSWYFGLLALCLIVAIGAAEWTRTYITTVAAAKKQFDANAKELFSLNGQLELLDAQTESLAKSEAAQGARPGGLVKESLTRQHYELKNHRDQLEGENKRLWASLQAGYSTLNRIMLFVKRDEVADAIVSVGSMLGGFFLPLLYGALGTCAFILRDLYAQMVERSFDPRRTGEFVVRLFLGMLSGITLQWVFVKDGNTIPGGITPAVLAFLGGYSVELLFTAVDRLVAAVTGSLRPSHTVGRTTRSAAAAQAIGAAAGAKTREM